MKNKTICILGGMGPQASSYFYDLMIKKSIELFGAKNNEDFPDILLFSIPIPDIIANQSERKKALKMLRRKVKEVNKLSIDSISIACNTAHMFFNNLQRESDVRFVSMVEEVVKTINGNKITKVGLLATPSTIKTKLYQKALSRNGIKTIIPSESQIKILEEVIRKVISGQSSEKDSQKIKKIADSLSKEVEGIVLGCTELPLVFPKEYKLPVFSSTEILVTTLLKNYYS